MLIFLLIIGSFTPSLPCGPFQKLDAPHYAIINDQIESIHTDTHNTVTTSLNFGEQIFRVLTSNIFLCFISFTLFGILLTLQTQSKGRNEEIKRLKHLLVKKVNKIK